jgi:hypothetical protein
MSDFLKRITDPFAERAKSPFYSAFIVSWIICNWNIIIALLYFDRKDLASRNLVNYISQEYLNVVNGVILPLIFALAYIFLMPVIDLHILKYSEKKKREKIDEKIKIGRGHLIDGNTHYDLKLKFEEEKAKIINLDTELNKLKGDLALSQNEVAALSIQTSNLERESSEKGKTITEFESRRVLTGRFEGRWTKTYGSGGLYVEEVSIRNNEYYVIENTVEVKKYKLKLIDFDIRRRVFNFVKYDSDGGTNHFVNELEIISNDLFEGTENTAPVTYQRRKFEESGNKKQESFTKLVQESIEEINRDKKLEDQVTFG